jgi:hypothetical protein
MDDELVTIATFAREHEAEFARGYLETNEVDVYLADDAMTRIASHLLPMIGGVKLKVRRQDVDRARELLAQVQSDPGAA